MPGRCSITSQLYRAARMSNNIPHAHTQVTTVRWSPPDKRPLLFLGRAEGTMTRWTNPRRQSMQRRATSLVNAMSTNVAGQGSIGPQERPQQAAESPANIGLPATPDRGPARREENRLFW
jgi:hypothetical protein